jgi:hypothetical protein
LNSSCDGKRDGTPVGGNCLVTDGYAVIFVPSYSELKFVGNTEGVHIKDILDGLAVG